MKILLRLTYLAIFFTASFNSIAQFKADFTADTTEGCNPLFVQFNDNSSGEVTSWKWDLGDGTISFEQNPSTIYTQPGLYTVKLVVSGADGTDSIEKINYIHVYESPTVDFSASPLSGCPPLTVNFTNNAEAGEGEIATIVWDFGDGKIASESSPSHVYTSSDTFGVTLTVTNTFGCKITADKPNIIQVYEGAMANFNYTYENICSPPTIVKFNNLSNSATAINYFWDFGNGTSSTEENPQCTYTQSGSYTITLKVTTDKGCIDTISKLISIGLVNPDFIIPEKACLNEPFSFQNNSSPMPVNAFWDFGDGTTATGIDVTHTYANAGTYQVKMDAEFGACNGSITKTITIGEKPVSAFAVDGSSFSCKIPTTINFLNQSANGNTYIWYFGDGDSSVETSPTHTYLKRGKYAVTLITFNSFGCSDTLVKTDLIQIGPLEIISLDSLPVKGCAPVIINPTAVINTTEPITSYQWNFGDGTTSNLQFPTHQYNNVGVYDVTLTITSASGCIDSFTLNRAVLVGEKVNPEFSATPTEVCAGESVSFTDLSDGDVNFWVWYFGDGSESHEQNPVHEYNDTGYFTVMLYVENNGCGDTITIEQYIKVNPPVARFISSLDCSNRFSRAFVDQSIGATSWNWDFGDGTTSTLQNPTHTYANSGLYNVVLTVTNGICTDDFTDSVNIISEMPKFSFSPLTDFCKNTTVNFTAYDFTEASINYFKWNFGDGTTLVGGPVVSHVYTQAGTVSPYLIVVYVDGCRDTVQNGEHFINLFGPTASFSNPEGVCINNPVTFTDNSTTDGTHPITSWTWDFGDSTIQTFSAPPFSHLYTVPGTYPVSLIVQDSFGCRDTLAGKNKVLVAKPVAAFALLDTIRCVESEVFFFNNSQGEGLSYLWDFGDGMNSVEQSPIHYYGQEGVYSVKLSITDKYGCKDSLYLQNILTISNPVATFILNDTFSVCPPLLIQPENTSSHYTSVLWNFGDGNTTNIFNPIHYYNTPGQYNITMIANGHGDCADTAYGSVFIKGPSGDFSYTPLKNCIPGTVDFTAVTKNTSHYIWDFNNGITTETGDSTITFSYENAGNYLPKLIIKDLDGCEVAITGIDTIKVGSVEAQISYTELDNCDSAQFVFFDSSLLENSFITDYTWIFNGKDSSSLPSPVVYFYNSAPNEVMLIVTTNLGCKDTAVQTVSGIIHTGPEISLSAPDSICLNLPVYFKAEEENNQTGISWEWSFGDENTSTEQNPVYTYTASNRYTVWVKGTNTNGCNDSTGKQLEVLALPEVDAGENEIICRNESVVLQASGANTYVWSPPSGLNCVNCQDPVAQPDSTIQYFVTGASTFGCAKTDSVLVNVIQPVTISLAALNDTLCLGESTQLEVTGAAFYNWTPVTGLNDPAIGNPVASPTQTTNYTIIGFSDTSGCFTDTAHLTVTVGPLPALDITDSLVTIASGSSYPINLSVSPDVVAVTWNPPYGLSCANCFNPTASPSISTTYTASAYNSYGCQVQDNIRIVIICNNSNVYIPNTFSPNNDGHNDHFSARGSGLFTIKKMQVFNRWGLPVFAKNNVNPSDEKSGWDGTYNGELQPADVYVYVIEIQCENGTILSYKGNVTLLR